MHIQHTLKRTLTGNYKYLNYTCTYTTRTPTGSYIYKKLILNFDALKFQCLLHLQLDFLKFMRNARVIGVGVTREVGSSLEYMVSDVRRDIYICTVQLVNIFAVLKQTQSMYTCI